MGHDTKTSEFACGFILRRGDRTLLLHHAEGHWAPPKGRVEPGETEIEAAHRELAEETGLTGVRIIDGFRHEISYLKARDGTEIPKRVLFFLAESPSGDVQLSDEHTASAWLAWDAALERATHAGTREALAAARAWAEQIAANGLKKNELSFDEDALRHIVRHYTRESGVRGMEREISKVCRKVVKEHLLAKSEDAVTVTADNTEHYLGVRKFSYGLAEEQDQVGQVTGLAWTSVGGELLTIESVSTPGKGRVTSTGSLGDVMQESIQAAWTVVKSRSRSLGIRRRQLDRNDLHIHVPEGATPKDGPSAGVAMCTAMVSVLCGIPVRADVAMTGEITLRGQVLAIGGLKEKLLAAHRGGIKTVLIPHENERDLKEIPDNIKQSLDIRPVKWIDQVLEVALTRTPTPLSEAEVEEDLALADEKARQETERPSTH